MRLLKLADFKRSLSVPLSRLSLWLIVLVCLNLYEEFRGNGAPHLIAEEMDEDEFDDEIDEDIEEETRRPARTNTRQASQAINEVRGVYGRFGHIAFPTFGRNNSITNVELVPFVIDGNDMVFGDGRFFIDNLGEIGGNGGVGVRRWVPGWSRVFGASLWYDYDDTTGNPFHQTGLSVETYGSYFDLRGNGYIPLGDGEKDLINRRGNFRYSGNQIILDYLRTFTESQPGFDVELEVSVPTEFARERNLRVAGGYYHFLGDQVADINGVKGRVEGSLTNHIDLQVEATNDDTYGTNLTLGVTWNFFETNPIYTRQSDEKLRQLTRYINRNYNIITTNKEVNSYSQAAVNPLTGQPYVVQHVSSTAMGTGSGTQDDPFLTIAEAQASNPDLILVHAGSELGVPVVLSPNQQILGEGIAHTISIDGIGNVLLPSITGGTALPVFRGVNGDAVTLASGSVFSGFVVDAPLGHAIVGKGITGATVRGVSIQNPGGDGVFLANSAGVVLFDDVTLTGAQGNAFHVEGGALELAYFGQISNSSNRIVLIQNTTGGSIHFGNAELLDDGGAGIYLANNAGSTYFGNVNIQNSTSSGINIQGGTGLTQFINQTTIANSSQPDIQIENASGTIDFGEVNVTNGSGADGIRIVNSPATTTFAALNVTTEGGTGLFARESGTITVSGGSINAINATAADIEGTGTNIDLTRVSSSNAVNGIRLVNSSGAFIVRGDGNDGSGGTIQGASVGVFAENAGTVALQSMNLDGNGTGVSANNAELVVFYSGQVVNSTSNAFNLQNVQQFELYNSLLSNNGGGAIRGQVDVANDYYFNISNSIIESTGSSPIVLTTLPSANDSTLSLALESNTITMTAGGSRALDLDWNGVLVSSIVGNTVTGSGASNVGFDITATSTTELAQISIGQNQLTFSGDGSIGSQITTSGASEISLGENTMVFNAANGVGASFAIGRDATIDIFDNAITDNVSRTTGVLFSSINGTSSVTIDNNNIRLLSADSLVDRGIIFNSVTGDVQLMGTTSNSINGATTPFSAIGTTGQIIVNGVLVP